VLSKKPDERLNDASSPLSGASVRHRSSEKTDKRSSDASSHRSSEKPDKRSNDASSPLSGALVRHRSSEKPDKRSSDASSHRSSEKPDKRSSDASSPLSGALVRHRSSEKPDKRSSDGSFRSSSSSVGYDLSAARERGSSAFFRTESDEVDSVASLFNGDAVVDSKLHDLDDDLFLSQSEDEVWQDDELPWDVNLSLQAAALSAKKDKAAAKRKLDRKQANKKSRQQADGADIAFSVDGDGETNKLSKKAARDIERAAAFEERSKSAKQARFEKTEERRFAACAVSPPASDEDGDDSGAKKRKYRASSGLDSPLVNMYARDYKLTTLDKDIVRGIAMDVLGNVVTSGDVIADGPENRNIKMAIVRNFQTKLNESCDIQLKQALMKYMQVEIFKEVTFERLIVAYVVAKRQAVGAMDNEILDIDWFEVISEFGVNLRDRLDKNNEAIMQRIYALIDRSSNLTSSQKSEEKKKYHLSMLAFRKHAVRIINKVIIPHFLCLTLYD
jgi:hypothetical protein